MVLALLERRWYKPYGGAELATKLILKLLADEGFDTVVITGNKSFNIKNINCIYSKLLDIPSKIHLWINLLKRCPSWLSKLIKKSDVIYIPRLAYPIIPLAKKYNKKVIVHLHDYQPITYCAAIFYPYNRNYNFHLLEEMKRSLRFEILENENIHKAILSALVTPLNKIVKLWINMADEIICVSEKQREIIVSFIPEISKKVKTIYNPLPKIPLFKKEFKNSTFMYLGGNSYVKGFHTFLDASQKVLKRNPNVKFLIVGNLKDTSKLAIKKLNTRYNGAYNLLGYLTHEEVLNLHSVTCALLFPSIWEEPLPYVILEAMLTGTIPVASRVGGVPEIVRGTCAEKFLFTPGDVKKMISKMEAILTMSKEQLMNMGLKLRESTLEQFNNERIKQELITLFEA